MPDRRHMKALRALSVVAVFCMAAAAAVATPGLPVAGEESPVADAAMRGDTETVRALLRQGADVNAAQGDGMTALHWSALNGDLATLRVLVYAGAALDPTTRLGGYTPLHLASRGGRAGAVAALLEAGADAAALTSTGVGALHLAAEAGESDAVAALLAHGAEADARDEQAGRTPLHFAAAKGRLQAMQTLLAAGADVSATSEVIDTVALAEQDSVERQTRQRIREAAKPPEEREERQPGARAGRGRGEPPPGRGRPGAPARAGQRPGNEPPDPDRPNRARPGEPPDPDRPTTPNEEPPGREPADPNVPRNLSYNEQVGLQGGFAPLHFAARDGHTDAALLLLEAGADIDQPTAGDQTSPMLMAVINGNYDLAMLMLERGADPNLVSDDGVGPLFAAINNEWALRTWYPQPTAGQQQQTSYLQLMEALLEAGADPNARTTTHVWFASYNAGRMGVDFTGATAFWRAAYGTDVEAMRLLVKHGADPNIPTMKLAGGRRGFYERPNEPEDEDEADPSGLPPVPPGGPAVHPLHAASGVGFGTSRVGQQHRHVPGGWMPAVRYLVEELGVDVNVRDHDGFTPLHNAAARGDNEMIEFLVAHGADVTAISRRGQSTVDMANGPQQRVQPFEATIALLESLGAVNNNNCRSC